jgi:hypothetical protein
MSRAHRWPWLVPPLLLLTLLWPVLDGRFFADDWQFVLADPAGDVFGSFERLHPYALYRPLQLSITALAQTLWPGTTLPVHLVSIGLHLLLIALMVHALTSLRASRLVIGVTVLVLTVSQLNAPALGGNDTLSLVMGTLFGCLAVWWFRPSAHRGGGRRTSYGLAALTVALLSKESSLGYVPLLLVMGIQPVVPAGPPNVTPSRSQAGRSRPSVSRRDAARLVGILLLAALYVAWRAHLGASGPDFGPKGEWRVDHHAAVNLVMLWSAALVPVSTVDVFTGVALGRWFWPLVAALGLGVVIVTTGIGLGPRRWGRALLYLAVASIAVAPVLLMKRVSELYAYALLPAAALLLGYGYGGALLDRRRSVRTVAAISLALFGVGQGVATRLKASAMADNGERAERQMAAWLTEARNLPAGATLTMTEPPKSRPQYSVYAMDGCLLTPCGEVARLSGRTDIAIVHSDGVDRPRMADYPFPAPGSARPGE